MLATLTCKETLEPQPRWDHQRRVESLKCAEGVALGLGQGNHSTIEILIGFLGHAIVALQPNRGDGSHSIAETCWKGMAPL